MISKSSSDTTPFDCDYGFVSFLLSNGLAVSKIKISLQLLLPEFQERPRPRTVGKESSGSSGLAHDQEHVALELGILLSNYSPDALKASLQVYYCGLFEGQVFAQADVFWQLCSSGSSLPVEVRKFLNLPCG